MQIRCWDIKDKMDNLRRGQSLQKLGGTDRLKQLQKNWLIILALGKAVVAEEPLKYKVGIEEDFLFNFLKRDQKSLEDKEGDSLWKKVDLK